MEKVICLLCKTQGYTASPKYVRCACGGRLKVMGVFKRNKKESEKEKIRRCDARVAHI